MEIYKMLTLSTAHIKKSTGDFLDNKERAFLTVYDKGEFGWFIYLTTEYLQEELKQIPSDLAAVIEFSIEQGCEVLCLDCDGEEVDNLPVFEW